jgi:hypothetical protein
MMPNKSTHRMSGDNVNLNFGTWWPPLIGGLARWAVKP